MDKETELLVERHRDAAFQHGFAVGFGLAAVGAGLGVAAFWILKLVGWWK